MRQLATLGAVHPPKPNKRRLAARERRTDGIRARDGRSIPVGAIIGIQQVSAEWLARVAISCVGVRGMQLDEQELHLRGRLSAIPRLILPTSI